MVYTKWQKSNIDERMKINLEYYFAFEEFYSVVTSKCIIATVYM